MFFTITQLGYKLNIFHLWHDFFKFATNKIFNDIKRGIWKYN